MPRKLITEEYILETCKNLGFLLKKIVIFNKSQSIIELQCSNCGNSYDTKFSYLLYRKDTKCDLCRPKGLTNFDESLYNKYGYSVLSPYVNNKTPLLLKHNDSGIEFTYIHSDFLKVKNKNYLFKKNKKQYIEKVIYNKINISDDNGNVIFPCEECGSTIERTYYKTIKLFKNKNYNINLCRCCNLKHKVKERTFDYINNNGLSVLDDFKTQKTPITIICPKCGDHFFRSIFSIKQGASNLCKSCSNTGTSRGEQEIYNFLDFLNIKYIKNYRLNNVELDAYIPDLGVGIEYNGYYWHSSEFKAKNYHINKTIFFEKNGIKVLHFYDVEWANKTNVVKNIITSNLNLNKKIYARNCQIKEVDTNIKDLFLNNTHLQGTDKSKVKLGLYFEGELVSIMTFLKSRFDKTYEWELSRFSSSNGISVVGGASKLFSWFIKTQNPDSVVSYANKRISNGNLYEKIGFNFVGNTPLGYNYFKNKTMYSRIPFQKHKLSKLFLNFDPNLTEYENMKNNNFYRCWDCGNLKYEYFNKK